MFVYYKTLITFILKSKITIYKLLKQKEEIQHLLRHTSLPNCKCTCGWMCNSQNYFHLWNLNDNSEGLSSPATPFRVIWIYSNTNVRVSPYTGQNSNVVRYTKLMVVDDTPIKKNYIKYNKAVSFEFFCHLKALAWKQTISNQVDSFLVPGFYLTVNLE